MTETALLNESLGLMAVGMTIVFGFLLLLVAILRGMSWVALKLAPAEPTPLAEPPLAAATATLSDQPDDLIAVIAAAVARYRSRH